MVYIADWSIENGYPYLTELGDIQPQVSDFSFVEPKPTMAWMYDGGYPYFQDEISKVVEELHPLWKWYLNKSTLVNIGQMFIRKANGLVPLHKAYIKVLKIMSNVFDRFSGTPPTMAWKVDKNVNDGYPYFEL